MKPSTLVGQKLVSIYNVYGHSFTFIYFKCNSFNVYKFWIGMNQKKEEN